MNTGGCTFFDEHSYVMSSEATCTVNKNDIYNILRTVHLEILGQFPMDGAYLYRDIFARFKTILTRQSLARASEIQKKKKWGQPCIFQR